MKIPKPDPVQNFDTYQGAALGTEKPLQAVVAEKPMLIAALKTAIAAGALVDLIKKGVIYGKEITQEQLNDAAGKVIDTADALSDEIWSDGADPEKIDVNPRLLHATLGAFGEEAEFLELLLKQIEGEDLDLTHVVEEAGDGQWYQALKLDEVEILTKLSPLGVWRGNIAKLAARHGKQFSLATSENRDTGQELAAMVRAAGTTD